MHRTAKVAIATLVSCVVVIGCGQGAVKTTDFSDRQIFEGVMLGAGPVADVLPEAREHLRPELYTRDDGELAAIADARAALVDAVDRAQPDLIADFARAARSGDPARIQPMLARATSALSGAGVNARPMNLPVDARPMNLPVDARPMNLPVDTRPMNLPVDARATSVALSSAVPGWKLFSNQLFTEQLALSVASTFGATATGR